MINGQIEFYDEDSQDVVSSAATTATCTSCAATQLAGPAPRVGDKVLFEPQPASGGPRAVAVRRLKPAPAPIDLRRGGVRT